MVNKVNINLRSGLEEYWVIAHLQKLVLIYTLQNGSFKALEAINEFGIIHDLLFPDLTQIMY